MKQIKTDQAPKADAFLSQAIISNNMIFVAGQVHVTPEGQLIDGSVAEKVAQIMKNISAILEAGSTSLDHVVKATIYVTDLGQMTELNQAYPMYFTVPYPAREAVCVVGLPLGATIEISVIAEI